MDGFAIAGSDALRDVRFGMNERIERASHLCANLSCIQSGALQLGLKVLDLYGRLPENPWRAEASPRSLGWLQLAAQCIPRRCVFAPDWRPERFAWSSRPYQGSSA